jgi:hypothetical protein
VSSLTSPVGSSLVGPVSPQISSAIPSAESHKAEDTEQHEENGRLTQTDSKSPYHELDSADTQRPKTAELPVPSSPKTPSSAPGLCHEAGSERAEALMPGSFPNVIKDAQRQKFTRVQSGDASVVTVGNKTQAIRPGSFEYPSRLRATMNATADDVKNNRHVNSWSHL